MDVKRLIPITIMLIALGAMGAFAATTNSFTLTDAVTGWTYQEGNLTGQRLTATGGLASSFSINGLNQLTQSWWWYRSGTGAYADTREVRAVQRDCFHADSSKPGAVDLSRTCGERNACGSASIPAKLCTHGHQQHSRLGERYVDCS